MKKLILIIIILFTSIAVNSQNISQDLYKLNIVDSTIQYKGEIKCLNTKQSIFINNLLFTTISFKNLSYSTAIDYRTDTTLLVKRIFPIYSSESKKMLYGIYYELHLSIKNNICEYIFDNFYFLIMNDINITKVPLYNIYTSNVKNDEDSKELYKLVNLLINYDIEDLEKEIQILYNF